MSAERTGREPVPILLTVYRLEVGGNERDLSKLARYLDPSRFEVHVACFHPDGERRAELEASKIPILHLPVRSFYDKTAITGARSLWAYLRRHKIQLIQAFDAPTSIYTVPLARLFDIRAVVSSHLFFRPLIPPPYYHALRLVDFLSDRIVVNAHAIKNHLIHDYGLPAERIFVSHNGVETGTFYRGTEPRPDFLQRASLIIGSLCVFREEKRLELLIEVFARLAPRHPGLRLLIVGDGNMREKWMALSEELGLGTSCHFELTTTGVPHWMRLMDIFVLPSRSEGFPNSLLEAMACGCAVVASNVGGVPEMVEHGRNGLLFSSGDSADLERQLLLLIENQELRKKMTAAAADDAKTRFNMEITARRMEAFYDAVLKER